MTDARALTQALGGRWHGHYGAAPCPVCQPERRKGQNALTRQPVTMALDGDATALQLCLDRIAPLRKDAPVTFALPPMQSARGAAQAAGAVLAAVAEGELTPTEVAHAMGLVETYRRTLETTELEARAAALEGGKA